jgi:hypothetical protein
LRDIHRSSSKRFRTRVDLFCDGPHEKPIGFTPPPSGAMLAYVAKTGGVMANYGEKAAENRYTYPESFQPRSLTYALSTA